MTSFIIQSLVNRKPATSWAQKDDCAFCRIVQGVAPATKLYEDEEVIAILDILPLRPGHTLVITKAHISKLSELPPELAGAMGKAVSKVARALSEATGNTGLNVVCNQEYAQAVPHVHYHIIPAPILHSTTVELDVEVEKSRKSTTSTPTGKEMHRMEFELREELDSDEAEDLANKVRARL
ncbi:hypothetical protein AGABI1DRAFT_58879 [Agaricus bisporus var. burnettii JB137-S8]|uniref:HIT domain-containing protein n=2 Tax=Agaricus bisporus var. burnettii TaxID=192524 RepID=K5X7Z9_AGABU|nr:uncharacterized protein AGABI1DRAFT_58879 [Agaricus bisporus var. burnettii JB137-S8]EKM79343.1 hypothetical protein AGABI1DRAFT_58879 [Agaricus bisporus var. burnettii JB137-S8]KAF7768117.1 hypothetical protein Agabi119p4_7360 [Agaricus bisporus var. burnettii]